MWHLLFLDPMEHLISVPKLNKCQEVQNSIHLSIAAAATPEDRLEGQGHKSQIFCVLQKWVGAAEGGARRLAPGHTDRCALHW